jgi:sec-independent protein translocase protein TatB
MLDVGFSEILLTSAIALIVLGPERLPKVARQVGNWMGRARAMARQLSEQLEREVSADELLKAQTKTSRSENLPNSGAAFDTSYTPTIAPATSPVLPPIDGSAQTLAPEHVPEPVYGLDAASTTAAAMHAADPPTSEPPPISEPAPTVKPSHE